MSFNLEEFYKNFPSYTKDGLPKSSFEDRCGSATRTVTRTYENEFKNDLKQKK